MRMLSKALLALGVGVLFGVVFTGCGGGGGGPTKTKVAFVSNNPENFWNIVEAGCRKAEKEVDVEVVFKKPSKGDAAVQTELLRTLVNQDIKAIAVSVIDPAGQKELLNEIADKLPLVTQDNDAPDSNRLCYIGTNNYEAGRAVGKLVKEAMPQGGVVTIFVGQTGALNARQRRQGVIDELAEAAAPANLGDFVMSEDGKTYGKYRVHRTYTDQPVGRQRCKENATDALTALADEPNHCMVGLWAYNPPEIRTAVVDRKLQGKVKIVGFDEDFATLEGIAAGDIYATVVQDPFNFGYEGVKILAGLAKGDKSVIPAGAIKWVPHRIVTKDGERGRLKVGPFGDELKKLLGQ